MKKYIPQIVFAVLILYFFIKLCFYILNIRYADDHEVTNPTQPSTNIEQYDESLYEYLKSSEKFKNDTNRISWMTEKFVYNDSNYHLIQLGYNTEFRFWTKQVLYINIESNRIYELNVFKDSLILWRKN